MRVSEIGMSMAWPKRGGVCLFCLFVLAKGLEWEVGAQSGFCKDGT